MRNPLGRRGDDLPRPATNVAKDKVVGDEENENEKQGQWVPVQKCTTYNHDNNDTLCMCCVYLTSPAL